MSELTSVFDILKNKLPDYENRTQQIEMAKAVFECLKGKNRLLAEAGTGVGKSFAYIIPAILSKEKTVVSTASIALQDQLANKDMAFLKNALPHEFSYAILKGKNNYLCLKREMEFADMGDVYKRFRQWASTTTTGDKDELPFTPDFWARVCGDSDDCNNRQCPFYEDCFYYRHYKHLHKIDILIVNHHLLIYDLLSEFSLLPFHTQLIIDEAHQLEDVISRVFGSTLTRSRIIWLLYRLNGLKIAVDDLFGPLESFFKERDFRPSSNSVYPIPDAVIEDLKNLKRLLALDKVLQRLEAYRKSAVDNKLEDKIETTIAYVRSLAADIDEFIEKRTRDKVYYMTVNEKGIELRSSLVESQRPFGELIKGYGSLVMTSATLAVGGDFSFLKERLGIRDFKEMAIDSPFDYKTQAVLYLNKELPPPDKTNAETFQRESLKIIEGLINASKGKAIVLFTSYSHLNFVSKNIRINFPFKSQGDMPPARLIQWFKDALNPVLLATATFWQGIDIKGEQLSLVVIAKMPFGSPGEPVYDERCRRLGTQWFSNLALPSAILLLRQGFGRLIRGAGDRGVVAILDSRLIKNSYGGLIISSLPQMKIVHTVDDVKRFFDYVSG